VEQFRRTGGWITPFIGNGEAMDKQPGQRQCERMGRLPEA
jgi:hypothetical protein